MSLMPLAQNKINPLGTRVNHRPVTLDYLLLFSFSSPKAKSLAKPRDREFVCKSMLPWKGVDGDTNPIISIYSGKWRHTAPAGAHRALIR